MPQLGEGDAAQRERGWGRERWRGKLKKGREGRREGDKGAEEEEQRRKKITLVKTGKEEKRKGEANRCRGF